MAGIGDWITGVLEKDGAQVASVVPKEGGIQWTKSWSIGKGTKNADIAKKFLQYMLSPEGQVHSARMAAYPAFAITKGGRKLLNEKDPKEAQRTGQVDGAANDPVTLIKEGRIKYRGLPQAAEPRGVERLLVGIQGLLSFRLSARCVRPLCFDCRGGIR